jgi:hypothetical protein
MQGERRVLVFHLTDPTTRERCTVSAGLAMWRHLGLGSLDLLSREEKMRVIKHLLPVLELSNPNGDDPQTKLSALRHSLHQVELTRSVGGNSLALIQCA